MAEKSTDIRSRTDDAVRELGEIDALLNELEDEIAGAADDIASATDTRSGDGLAAEADPIAGAAEELDDDAACSAQSVDDALEKVAAEIQSETNDEIVARESWAFDESAGEDSIAAQIDEELARALDDRDDEAEPVAQADARVESMSAAESPVDNDADAEPADAQATDDAVHALAEALDRLLDDDVEKGDKAKVAADADGSDAEPEPEAEAGADSGEDEAPAAPVAPTAAPIEPTPPPAPAPKPEPKRAPAPAPVAVVDTKTKQPRSFSPKSVLISALALVNKPFAGLPPQVRDTIGLAGLVTIFNAACLWVFLLIR